MKKHRKNKALETYNVKSQLEGHIFSFGRVGSGKSVSTLSIIQSFKDNYNYKIWDIFGGERHEGLYWCFPSEDDAYWNRFKMMGQMDEPGPKQYKVNLMYPYFESKLPKKLPKKLPNVQSKLFTIPLKSITVEDVKMVCGNLSESSIYAWNEIVHNAKKVDNSGSLLKLADKVKGIQTTSLYKNFVIPMHREKFIGDQYNEFNLDIIEEAKDRESVFVLCLDFVPVKYHLLVIYWILRNHSELVDINKIQKKNIMFLRESATFFRASDDSILEDRFKIFRTAITHLARMGRRGQYYAFDMQSAQECKGILSGSEDYMLIFRTQSYRDKDELLSEPKKEKRVRVDQMANLAFHEKGEALVLESGRVAKKVKIRLPRTMYWKNTHGNFYKVLWGNHGGGWSLTEEAEDYINERYVEAKESYEPTKLYQEQAKKKLQEDFVTDEEDVKKGHTIDLYEVDY